jgi:hypothetical protein
VPDPEIWALTSKQGWPKFAYGKAIWIPCRGRLQAAMPDIDELGRNISVEPL